MWLFLVSGALLCKAQVVVLLIEALAYSLDGVKLVVD